MKKVFFFSHSQALGGAELSMLDIAARIDRDKFLPVMLAPGPGPLADRASELEIGVLETRIAPQLLGWQRVHSVRPATLLSAFDSVSRLAAVLRTEKPDVLYTHSQKAHVLGGLAGRLAGVPVVWHLREMLTRKWLRRFMSGMSLLAPSGIVCVSQAVAGQFPQAGTAVRLEVIPNGLDVPAIRRLSAASPRNVRGKLGLPPRSPLVGMTSRIAPGKGQHVFIEAASRVAEAHPAARFLIVGGPLFGEEAYLQKLRRQVENLELGRKVILAGHLGNPLPAMKELDVLVHCPVVPEGFGRSVAEAMALRVPVASVRGGGIPELIEDGVTGLLVSPGDAGGLSEAVSRLLSDPALGRGLARAASEKIESRFKLETTVSNIEKVLLSI